MLTSNQWRGKFLILKNTSYSIFKVHQLALNRIHIRCACIWRGSNLIEQNIDTQVLFLSTPQAPLGPMLSLSLCSGWLLPSAIPTYVPLLLGLSRFTVEKEGQVTLILTRLLKIVRNLNVTEPLEHVRVPPPAQKQPHTRPRQSPGEQIVLVPSCGGVLHRTRWHTEEPMSGGAEFVHSTQGTSRPSRQREVIAAAPEASEAKAHQQRMP